MGQIFLPDNIPYMTKTSSTTAQLAATNTNKIKHALGQPTRITLGGQQYKLSSALTINTAISGAGGIDAGSVANTTTVPYVVYAIVHATTRAVALVFSLALPAVGPTIPSGYVSGLYKPVGAFVYNSGIISDVLNWTSFTPSISGVTWLSLVGKAKRTNDSMEIDVDAQTSGNASGVLSFTIPFNNSIDSTKYASVAIFKCGGKITDVSDSNKNYAFMAASSGATTLTFYFNEPGSGNLGNTSSPAIQTSDYVRFFLTIPIIGWTTENFLQDLLML